MDKKLVIGYRLRSIYLFHDSGSQRANNQNQTIKMLYCRSNILKVLDRALSRMIPHLCLCILRFLQSCNKSLIDQACAAPYWENIGPRSFLYGPLCARSILSRLRADILPVRPSRLVNKIYLLPHLVAIWPLQDNCSTRTKNLAEENW